MNRKSIIIILFCLMATAGWAQTEETAYAREKSNWAVGVDILYSLCHFSK